jgi:hypothetical protein
MTKLSAHIIGIDSPLGVLLAKNLNHTDLSLSGTKTNSNSYPYLKIDLENLNISIYKNNVRGNLLPFEQDYLICLDSSLDQTRKVLQQLIKHHHKSLSCYKIMCVAMSQPQPTEIMAIQKTINQLAVMPQCQKMLVSLPELYGEGLLPKSNIGLSGWLSALNRHQIYVPKNQTKIINPLYIADAAREISRLIFMPLPGKSKIILTGATSIPAINLSLMLQSHASREEKGKYIIKKANYSHPNQPQDRTHVVYPHDSTPLEIGLNSWIQWVKQPGPLLTDNSPTKSVKPKSGTSSARQKKVSLSGMFRFLGLLLMVGSFFIVGLMALVKDGGGDLLKQQVKSIIGIKDWSNQAESVSLVSASSDELTVSIINTLDDLKQGNLTKIKYNTVKSAAKQVRFQLNSLSTRLTSSEMNNQYSTQIDALNLNDQLISFIEATVNSGNSLHALVLHDGREWWGVGGRVRGVVLIEIGSGGMSVRSVSNVGSLDADLDGIVSPPSDLAYVTGEESWYLKDANWSPEIPLSAESMAWFLEKETGIKPGSVIGLDINRVSALLGLDALPSGIADDYPTVVARIESALRSQSLKDKETTFMSGSWLMEELRNNYAYLYARPVLAPIYQAERHPSTCVSGVISPYCIDNYVMFHVSNIGGIPIDQVVLKKEEHTITRQEDQMFHQHRVLIANTDPTNSYQALLRVHVSLGGTRVIFKHDDFVVEPEQSISRQGQYGYIINLPPNSHHQIDVSYMNAIPANQKFYRWQYLAQAGTGLRPLTIYDGVSMANSLAKIQYAVRQQLIYHIEL